MTKEEPTDGKLSLIKILPTLHALDKYVFGWNGMKDKLCQNAHKGNSWMDCPLEDLTNSLKREIREFDYSCVTVSPFSVYPEDVERFTLEDLKKIQNELVDIGNFCMMNWGRIQMKIESLRAKTGKE